MKQHVRGQSLVLVALFLPLLIVLLLTGVDLAERQLQLALIQDAVQQAARSAVQRFDYQAFAAGEQALSPALVEQAGCAALSTNLAGVRGLLDSPAQTANQAVWTVLPRGGTCTFPHDRPPVSATTPLVCVTLRPQLRGWFGQGAWTPQIDAAATLDHSP